MFRGETGADKKQRVDSWKEIAAFFGRDERTVKRWEQTRSLPVHRVPGALKGGVFAYAGELREWLHSAQQEKTGNEVPSAAASVADNGRADGRSAENRSAENRSAEKGSAENGDLPQRDCPEAPSAPQLLATAALPAAIATPLAGLTAPVTTANSIPVSSPTPNPGWPLIARGSLLEMPRNIPFAAAASSDPIPPPAPQHRPAPAAYEPRTRSGSIHDRRVPSHRTLLWLGAGAMIAVALLFSGAYLLHIGSAPAALSGHAGATGKGTQDPQARDFYLKGRYYWNRRSADSLNQAVDAFTQAIVHDPAYAEAYAGLADCYDLMSEYTSMPSSEAYPRAIAAATKAVSLDDSLSEAHRALAFGLFFGNFEIPRAVAEYRRAIELDPGDIEAHHWFATSMLAIGRYREAFAEMERARQLDPTSRSILADRALIVYSLGDHAGAMAQLRELEQAEPAFLSPPRYLANLALDEGDYPEFLVQTRRAATLSKDPQETEVADAAERGWTSGGKTGLLEGMWKVQKKYFDMRQTSGFQLAVTSAALGRKREAVTYLRSAYAQRDSRILSLSNGRLEEELKGEPGFAQLKVLVETPMEGMPPEGGISTRLLRNSIMLDRIGGEKPATDHRE